LSKVTQIQEEQLARRAEQLSSGAAAAMTAADFKLAAPLVVGEV